MSQNVTLPALGESVTEGTVTRWLKKVGDTVAVDEPLVEVSTDKVDTEIPSPVAGVIEQILVQEDETVEVGAVLVIIGDGSSASAPAAQPAAAAPAPVAEPVAAPAAVAAPVDATPPASAAAAPVAAPVAAPIAYVPPAPIVPAIAQAPALTPAAAVTTKVPASHAAPATAVASSDAGYVTPLVRKLASESGIDLSTVAGTGVGGRIRKDDVIAAATTSNPLVSATTHAAAADSALRGTSESMSRLRKVLAERAVASMQQTAQLTTVVEVDVTKIAQLRQQVQSEFVAKTGGKSGDYHADPL